MQPTEFITVQPPAGIVADQFLGKPDSNRPTVYDLGRQVNLANESAAPTDRYPVSIRETTQEVWVKNATVIGTQPRGLTWRQMKSDYDGDAVRMETSGQKTVDGLYAENVEDAFSPRGFGPWTLQNSWLRWIRDDVVENDSLLSGTIENCLCDGVFMGLSCRPGAQTPPEAYAETKFTVAIRNSLIHLQKMPNGDTRFMDGEGNAHGKLFKWGSHNGRVEMRDTIILMDRWAERGASSMQFVDGVYERVTLVLGPEFDGPFPCPLPDGVTVSRDVGLYYNARQSWIIENSWRFPNRNIMGEVV